MEDDWPRPVVHWEIQSRDGEATAAFYKAMFNWEITGGRIQNIAPGIGAPEQLSGHILPSDTSRVVLYVQVRSLRESLDRAASLGGKILREPRDLPTGQTIAGIADPEGNQVVLVQQ